MATILGFFRHLVQVDCNAGSTQDAVTSTIELFGHTVSSSEVVEMGRTQPARETRWTLPPHLFDVCFGVAKEGLAAAVGPDAPCTVVSAVTLHNVFGMCRTRRSRSGRRLPWDFHEVKGSYGDELRQYIIAPLLQGREVLLPVLHASGWWFLLHLHPKEGCVSVDRHESRRGALGHEEATNWAICLLRSLLDTSQLTFEALGVHVTEPLYAAASGGCALLKSITRLLGGNCLHVTASDAQNARTYFAALLRRRFVEQASTQP